VLWLHGMGIPRDLVSHIRIETLPLGDVLRLLSHKFNLLSVLTMLSEFSRVEVPQWEVVGDAQFIRPHLVGCILP
jgi:hypothetical protein